MGFIVGRAARVAILAVVVLAMMSFCDCQCPSRIFVPTIGFGCRFDNQCESRMCCENADGYYMCLTPAPRCPPRNVLPRNGIGCLHNNNCASRLCCENAYGNYVCHTPRPNILCGGMQCQSFQRCLTHRITGRKWCA